MKARPKRIEWTEGGISWGGSSGSHRIFPWRFSPERSCSSAVQTGVMFEKKKRR